MPDMRFKTKLTSWADDQAVGVLPKDILDLLDLPEGATEAEVLERIKYLKFRKERIEEFVRQEAQRLVDDAIRPNAAGISKLYESEREEIVRLGHQVGLAALEIFIEARRPIFNWMREADRKRGKSAV